MGFASTVRVRCPAALRMAIVLVPLSTTATRLHEHRLEAPDVATQELNRCLKLVNIAASRRRGDRNGRSSPCNTAPVATRSDEVTT